MMACSDEQIVMFISFTQKIGDHRVTEDRKTSMMCELMSNMQHICRSPLYPQFLIKLLKSLIKLTNSSVPSFVIGTPSYVLRKKTFELLSRLIVNDQMKPHINFMLLLCVKALEIDNEEVGFLAIRIIIDIIRKFKPPCNSMITAIIKYTQSSFSCLPGRTKTMFSPKPPVQVRDLSDLDIEALLDETYVRVLIQRKPCNKKEQANQITTVTS